MFHTVRYISLLMLRNAGIKKKPLFVSFFLLLTEEYTMLFRSCKFDNGMKSYSLGIML